MTPSCCHCGTPLAASQKRASASLIDSSACQKWPTWSCSSSCCSREGGRETERRARKEASSCCAALRPAVEVLATQTQKRGKENLGRPRRKEKQEKKGQGGRGGQNQSSLLHGESKGNKTAKRKQARCKLERSSRRQPTLSQKNLGQIELRKHKGSDGENSGAQLWAPQ